VHIEIEDTGPGIPSDSLERIFNPFYTTKPVGHGTGLGLSISLGIISEHGGRIWAENVASGGAKFCIDLPLIASPAGGPTAIPATSVALPDGLRLLVADDEAPIRESLSRLLERAGHLVTAVDGGAAALAAARDRAFDAILLDIRMPDISGMEVFEQWRTERPELASRVVFLTGDIVSADLQEFLAGTGQPFLAKPFELATVLQVLQQTRR
jgi:two-component system NtrC family sensor kinase